MKSKFLSATLTGLILAASCLVNSANAGLITDNDGFVTDTVTGFDWLDTSFTDGMSFDLVNTEISTGTLKGWEVATLSEVLNLFLHQNDNVALSANTGRSGRWSTAYIKLAALADMLGESYSGYLIGYIDGDSNYKYNGTQTQRSVQIGSGSNYFLRDDSWGYANNVSEHYLSTWLVRKNDVPEPSTFAIFALSILGLASRRFKK